MNHAGLSTTARAPMSVMRRMTRVFGTLTAACALAVGLASCAGNYDSYDPASGATRDDYKSLVGRRGQDQLDAAKTGEAPPIPAFQSVLAAPSAPELADTRRVSLSVTETTPVRDIIIELARKAEVDLELDPRISGGIVLSVTDRPFIDVIERVTELAELRYTFDKNVLKVELDDPYLEQYRMDVLNQTRDATGTISSSTDASSATQAIGGGGGGGGNNKSDSSVKSSSQTDFWKTVSGSVGQILNNIQSRRGSAAGGVSEHAAAPLEDAGADTKKEAPAGGSANPVAAAANLARAQETAVSALATEKGGGAGAQPQAKASQAAVSAAPVLSSNFSINPEAGLITVFATKRQHIAIDKYLRAVRNSVMQQVLIEAKILEITLNDQFRSGINWQAFMGAADANGRTLNLNTNFTRNVVTGDIGSPTVGVSWRDLDGDLSVAAQLVKQFGTVRTLSNPRITVLNNQSAILKVAQNQIFFDLDVQQTQSTVQGGAPLITVDSEIKSVPVGLVMNVQPAVDPLTKRINMSLRPSITRITGYVSDPAVAYLVAQTNNSSAITSQIPIIESRELDSLITMDSGQTVVLGGLMQDTSENSREGLPGAMDIPVLGHAVSSNIRSSKVTELVIFIRATVVDSRGTVADEDIRLYKTFTPDPRPIAF